MERTDRAGFTLPELLVVIAIVGILLALLVPALSRAKRRGQRTACTTNLRQIDLAIRLYADDSRGILPILGSPSADGDTVWEAFRPMLQRYVGIRSSAAPGDKIFTCPADTFSVGFGNQGPARGGPAHQDATGTNFTSYLFNGYNTKTNPPNPGIAGQQLGSMHSPARTVLVAEGPAFVGFSWHVPHPELVFSDAFNEVGFADGHTSFIKIFWKGPPSDSGSARCYNPPFCYDYVWSND